MSISIVKRLSVVYNKSRKSGEEVVIMYAKVESLGLNGLDAFSVTVEADISTGLPRFDIVGLPDMAVRESRDAGAGDH